MAKNPLYRNFAQELEKQARRDFNKSTYGKIIKGMNDLERRGAGAVTQGKVNALISKYGRGGFDKKKIAKEIENKELAQLTKTLETYAKRGGTDKLAVDYLLKELGPIGAILKAAFGSKAKKTKPQTTELSAAQKLLEAFGYTVLPKKQKGKRLPRAGGARGKKAGTTSSAISRGIDRAREWLESVGYHVPDDPEALEDPQNKVVFPQGQTGYTKKGDPRRIVEVDIEGGRRRLSVDHPMMSGEMMPAGGSNVHSYSYDLDARTLYVRFLGEGFKGRRVGKGPLYAYYNVQPNIFEGMLEAKSKGKFVWQQLRDGDKPEGGHSIHSHFYNYRLVGVENDYVPRKAMLGGFAKRTILTSRNRELSSSTNRRGTNLSPPPLNRGTPNRGTPNRGR